MTYVVKRRPVKYLNGTYSDECYLMGSLLGFTELTTHIEEAQRFTRKAEAAKIAKTLGRIYYVEKI